MASRIKKLLDDSWGKEKPEVLGKRKVGKRTYRVVKDCYGEVVVEYRSKDAMGRRKWEEIETSSFRGHSEEFARLLLGED